MCVHAYAGQASSDKSGMGLRLLEYTSCSYVDVHGHVCFFHIGLYLALPPSSTELQGCWVSHKLVEGWQNRAVVGHPQSGQ